MKVFQDLEIKGSASKLLQLVAAVEQDLRDGWTLKHEQGILASTSANREFCFACTATAQRKAAELWLVLRQDKTVLRVGNIVPREQRSLSYDEYNQILREFYHEFVKPQVDRLSLHATLSRPEVTIDDFASPATVKLLMSFSRTTNRATGATHPSDSERFNRFVISAHESHDTIDTDILQRWLVEEEGWSIDEASELTNRYVEGRSLLDTRDSAHAGH
jgi:hypothetical protein